MADVFNTGKRRARVLGPATEGNYNPGIDRRKPNGFKLMIPWGSGNNQLRTMTGIEGMNTPDVESTEAQDEPITMNGLLDLNQGGMVGQRGPLGEYGISSAPRSQDIYQNLIYPFNPNYSPFNTSGYFHQAITELQTILGDIYNIWIYIIVNRGGEIFIEPGCGLHVGGVDNLWTIDLVLGQGLECVPDSGLTVKLDGNTLSKSASGLKGNYEGGEAIEIEGNTIDLKYNPNMFRVNPATNELEIKLDTCE